MALPFFDTTMIHLTPNAASNVVSLSPYQARKYLATFTHYLIVLTNEATEATHAAVLAPSVDNERETKFDLPTDADAARSRRRSRTHALSLAGASQTDAGLRFVRRRGRRPAPHPSRAHPLRPRRPASHAQVHARAEWSGGRRGACARAEARGEQRLADKPVGLRSRYVDFRLCLCARTQAVSGVCMRDGARKGPQASCNDRVCARTSTLAPSSPSSDASSASTR